MRIHAVFGPVALVLAALTLTACVNDPGGSAEASFDPLGPMRDVLNDAVKAGASDAQLDILREALVQGEVTRNQLTEAIEATLICVEDAGLVFTPLTFEDTGSRYESYFYSIGYGPGSSEEQSRLIMDSCMNTHSLWVEIAYQAVQPEMVEQENARFEAAKPAVIQCIRENGISIDDDATRDEISRAVSEVLFGPEQLAQIEREAQLDDIQGTDDSVFGNVTSSWDDPEPNSGPIPIGPNCFQEASL